MLLSGPNGVGKSHLVSHWKDGLDLRLYHPIAITQASLSHAGLLSYITRKLGKPSGNRSTNLIHLEEALSELGETTAVIILDEAQNYSHAALEEIRLLLGLDLTRRSAFSLILIGDDYLLGHLRLRSHRALQPVRRPLPGQPVPATDRRQRQPHWTVVDIPYGGHRTGAPDRRGPEGH